MDYTFSKMLNCSFDDAVNRTTEALKAHKFGVLTTINMHEKFAEKLGKTFRPYRILGACSPSHAYEALSHEPNIGTMLPCNVVVQEWEPGKVEISAIDPIASMQAVQNIALGQVATEVQANLKAVIDSL